MVAVAHNKNGVEKLINSSQLDLVIANHNSHQQVVVAGKLDQIASFEKFLLQHKIASTRLKVGAAFHSPLMADAQKPFQEALNEIAICESSAAVFSNITATEYPKGIELIKLCLPQKSWS